MKKILLFIIVVLTLLVCSFPISAITENQDDIIILYENDVHCEIEGYSILSAMRNELKQEYEKALQEAEWFFALNLIWTWHQRGLHLNLMLRNC